MWGGMAESAEHSAKGAHVVDKIDDPDKFIENALREYNKMRPGVKSGTLLREFYESQTRACYREMKKNNLEYKVYCAEDQARTINSNMTLET